MAYLAAQGERQKRWWFGWKSPEILPLAQYIASNWKLLSYSFSWVKGKMYTTCTIAQIICELAEELASVLLILEHRHNLTQWMLGGGSEGTTKNKERGLTCKNLRGLQSLWPSILVVLFLSPRQDHEYLDRSVFCLMCRHQCRESMKMKASWNTLQKGIREISTN